MNELQQLADNLRKMAENLSVTMEHVVALEKKTEMLEKKVSSLMAEKLQNDLQKDVSVPKELYEAYLNQPSSAIQFKVGDHVRIADGYVTKITRIGVEEGKVSGITTLVTVYYYNDDAGKEWYAYVDELEKLD